MDITTEAFQLYIQGYSLRNLEKRFHIPRTTLAYRFKKLYGDNYSQLKNSQGLMAVVKEYLRSPALSQKDKNSIRKWLYSNHKTILESDVKNHQSPLLSDHQLQNLTLNQCGHKTKDWKALFESTLTA